MYGPFFTFQVRKLEFTLAEALEKGCDSVITCGGLQSNHARATAVACRELGLQPHLMLRWKGKIVCEWSPVKCSDYFVFYLPGLPKSILQL